jgi:hypothetical protein
MTFQPEFTMRHRICIAKGPLAGNQVKSKGLNLSLAWFGLACLAGMHRPWWISATGAVLERLRAGLTGCIGCGCLSLARCKLANRAARRGSDPRFWLGDPS